MNSGGFSSFGTGCKLTFFIIYLLIINLITYYYFKRDLTTQVQICFQQIIQVVIIQRKF